MKPLTDGKYLLRLCNMPIPKKLPTAKKVYNGLSKKFHQGHFYGVGRIGSVTGF